jgi:type I restriction enzyme M protein
VVQAAAQEPRQEELRTVAEDIQRICDTFLAFEETEQSKIFPNAAFGYWKVTVERPLRLHSQLTRRPSSPCASPPATRTSAPRSTTNSATPSSTTSPVSAALEKRLNDWGASEATTTRKRRRGTKKGLPEKKKKKLLDPKTWERDGRLVDAATKLKKALGDGSSTDHNAFRRKVGDALDKADLKLGAADLKQLLRAVSWRDDSAPPVIAKVHKPGKATPDPLHGLFEVTIDGKRCVVEYEPDSDLRDSEQVPLLEEGGIEAFIRREVLPYTPDAWVDESKTQIGYEVSFTRHFYKPQRLRTLEEISADILATEKEADAAPEDRRHAVRAHRAVEEAARRHRGGARQTSRRAR